MNHPTMHWSCWYGHGRIEGRNLIMEVKLGGVGLSTPPTDTRLMVFEVSPEDIIEGPMVIAVLADDPADPIWAVTLTSGDEGSRGWGKNIHGKWAARRYIFNRPPRFEREEVL